ncbi:MAG: HAD-IA family hydrolase [Acholeplasmataceae bacterium]|nr:HAD-IA family hydrolase [Acholeplasmataceae bacterium]
MKMIKTFLFDLDGTLIQTPELILKTFKITFDKYFPEIKLSTDEESNLLGHTLFETFGNYTTDQNLIDEMVSFYRMTSESFIEKGLTSYEGALEILKHLKHKKKNIGVVTSKMIEVATHHLDLVGLLPYVDHLIGYESTKLHKPHPDPILKALEIFNAKNKETIYVGDHENDIKAAKAANIQSCAVTYSMRTKQMLFENPDFVIDELKNLKDLI